MQEWHVIEPYPPSPSPVTRCTFMINFSTLYISYIFQLKFKLTWPLCIFLTHKNTKSHIIKTHNCCESIKRELKQKSNVLKFIGKCTVHQCFYFTTRWWVHRVPSSIECVVDLTCPWPKHNPTGIQNKPFVIPRPLQGWYNWGKDIHKKESHRKKKKCSSWNPFFSADCESHLKEKKIVFFLLICFPSSLKTKTSVWLYITPAIMLCAPVKW